MAPKISWPVVGKYRISFLFGEAPDWYVKIFGGPHNGLDIACPVMTPVVACDDGEVSFSDNIPDSNGKGLILKHEWGISLYWHLSGLIANLGNKVEKGVLIAQSGDTGYCTGPHLHFAIKVFGAEDVGMKGWSDPLRYMPDSIFPPQESAPVEKTYMVRPGDSLWGIAEKFYRNGFEWKRIYLANKDKISNPNLIRPFQKLRIP